jgi:hypothetical protein
MAIVRVLIVVKTYPTISVKYDELVCTAGFTEQGEWVRIYPIQFRKLDYSNQYSKYDWIELDIVKNTSDFRPESYRPLTLDTQPNTVGSIKTEGNWLKRKDIVLKKVYDNMDTLIAEAKDNQLGTSLATFKPTKIVDFTYEPVEREWGATKIAAMKQLSIFEKRGDDFKVVRKLPYKFSYVFEDVIGKRRTMMIEDWEVGALFWKYSDEKEACEKVKEKYLNDFALTKDLYFFLGTTQQFHNVAPNPFIIIGAFPAPFIQVSPQLSLFS